MRKKWTENEIKLLLEKYSISDNVELLEIFKGRTLESIRVKAKRLKLRRNDSVIFKNRSDSRRGEKNGMFGKSIISGKTYEEQYGIEKANIIKNKLSKNKKGSVGLSGEKNGMYGKIPYNKGKSPSQEIKEKIKQGIINYWKNLKPDELEKRKNQLRGDWIKKRNKYIEIDTIPEKIVESVLIELKLNYLKKENIGYYNCDFIIENKIIEVHGDYWHANPKFYSKSNLDKIQRKNVNRDKNKLTYLLNRGFDVLITWEYDLKTNLNICKEEIIKFINDGKY